MRNQTPLAYVTSVVVFMVVVSFAATFAFSVDVRSRSWPIIGAPLQVLLSATGAMLGLGALMARPLVATARALGDLWCQPVARIAASWQGELTLYCQRARFYHPEHAA